MKNKAFTLVELLIVVAIIAMLATAGTIVVLRQRAIVFEAIAQRTLQTIGMVMERYAMEHGGYPEDLAPLVTATPPYISEDYLDGQARCGYLYSRSGTPPEQMFIIEAIPTACHVTGNKEFTVRSGMVYSESECAP